MEHIIIFLVIILLIVAFFYFGQSSVKEPMEDLQQEKNTQSSSGIQSSGNKTFFESSNTSESSLPVSESSPIIHTYIVIGPKQGEIVETNKVVFGFTAKIFPSEGDSRVFFETKLQGIDKDWQKSFSDKRTITLPLGPAEYTLSVRAGTGDFVDPTPTQRTFETNISPYFDKVKISNIKPKDSSNPLLITLTVRLGREEKVDITGWRIEGKRGGFTIPQGVEKYPPSNTQIIKEDIFVKSSDKIYLFGSSNPLARATDYRLNKCFGYLANNHDFPIKILRNCPKPTKEEVAYLEYCCQEFVLKVPACEFPDYAKSSDVSEDPDCLGYIFDRFNYTGCFSRHSYDENFLDAIWHIYMRRDFVPDDVYDVYYLFDKNGFVVNKYEFGKCPTCE